MQQILYWPASGTWEYRYVPVSSRSNHCVAATARRALVMTAGCRACRWLAASQRAPVRQAQVAQLPAATPGGRPVGWGAGGATTACHSEGVPSAVGATNRAATWADLGGGGEGRRRAPAQRRRP